MGAPKQKWTAEEEEALRAGVDKHGAGKWRNIQKDPEFACWLAARSNIDLKDKWRNMNVSASGQGSREKSRSLKLKVNPTTPSVNAMVSDKKVPDALPAKIADCSKGLNDGKHPASRYTEMIFETLSALPDPNGTEVGAIVRFIEGKHEVPSNFRKKLSSKLRQLAQQGKIEKVHNGYKLINSSLGIRTPTAKPTDPFHRSKLSANSALHTTDMVEKTAISIASEIAEAEIKSQMAYKAMLEAERVQRLAEKTDAMLQLAKEFYEQCRIDNTSTRAILL